MKDIRTAKDLRDTLADEISRLRKHRRTPAEVNAVTNAAGKILMTIRMEMEYNKLLGITPKIPFINNLEPKRLEQHPKQTKQKSVKAKLELAK